MISAARLRRSRDIAAVRSDGRSLRRAAFAARVRANDGQGTRIAVTATRTIGSSVVRNRARRRVREAFRRQSPAALASNLDIVVSVRPEAVSMEFPTLLTDAASLLLEAAR